MIYNQLFFEYEQILLGNMDSFSSGHFKDKNKIEAQKAALMVCSFAFENYLHLSPYETKSVLNKALIEKLKLDLVLPYIQFPVEFDKDTDFYYILSLLYPEQIKISENERVLHYYSRILEKNERFANGYFVGEQGRRRACICLRYAISKETKFNSISDLYLLFSENRRVGGSGKKFLKEYRLDHCCYDLYESKIDYLHDALPASQKNTFLYYYYRYRGAKIKISDLLKPLGEPYIVDKIPVIK